MHSRRCRLPQILVPLSVPAAPVLSSPFQHCCGCNIIAWAWSMEHEMQLWRSTEAARPMDKKRNPRYHDDDNKGGRGAGAQSGR
jgi:hypothetical protein